MSSSIFHKKGCMCWFVVHEYQIVDIVLAIENFRGFN
jgi:hypothetical protein